MIVYNITVKAEWPVAAQWLRWAQDMYIPGVIATKCFEKSQLVRLLQIDEMDGPTYAIQFYARDLRKYDEYLSSHASAFRKQTAEMWGDKCLDFHTLMEVVE